MKVSLFSQSLFAVPLREAIEMTAAIGFPAIELACVKPHFDLNTTSGNPEGTVELIREKGLKVSALSLFNNFTDTELLEEQVALSQTYIRMAPLFGAKVIKMTPGPPDSRNAKEEHWRSLAAALDRLSPVAEETGVLLAFETHMGQLTDTLAGSRRLLDMAKSEVIGMTVDFSNLVFAGEQPADIISSLRGRIYNTHIKNGIINADGSYRFLELDKGLTDYTKVLSLLRRAGYRGYLTVECLGEDAAKRPFETASRDLVILNGYLKRIEQDSDIKGECDG